MAPAPELPATQASFSSPARRDNGQNEPKMLAPSRRWRNNVISSLKRGVWLSGLFAVAVGSGNAAADVLKPLADGFPNKPLTLVIADDPGTREGVWAVNIQAALKEVSPVEVLVSNEPGPTFGTWFTIGDVKTREGGLEGYYLIGMTIPGMVADLPVEPITKETGLDADDMNPVIVTETIPYIGVQRKNAPWGKTFADMVKYAKENPGKITYISNQVGSGNDIAMEWVAQQLGITFNKIPAESTEAQAAAMGAGEGDWALTQAPAALQLVQADKVDVTFVTGDTVPAMWQDNTNIVTGKDAGLPDAPFGIMQGILVPTEVPQERQEWLFQLFKAAAETDTYKQREKSVPGLTVTIIPQKEANEAKMKILEYVDPVVRNLGMHIDQQ
jgi:tripartite-type tricarboxylate transporter receptor subunit TctC